MTGNLITFEVHWTDEDTDEPCHATVTDVTTRSPARQFQWRLANKVPGQVYVALLGYCPIPETMTEAEFEAMAEAANDVTVFGDLAGMNG